MDFPKTIYVGDEDMERFGCSAFFAVEDTGKISDTVAIYTLKEVKKKVTEVKLENI
jgi:hypothetical protein